MSDAVIIALTVLALLNVLVIVIAWSLLNRE